MVTNFIGQQSHDLTTAVMIVAFIFMPKYYYSYLTTQLDERSVELEFDT